MSRATEISKYYDQLKGKRSNFDNTNQEIVDFIAPLNADITNTRTPGTKKTANIFDTTAGYGAHILSQFVQGSIINQGTRWFSLTNPDESQQDNQEYSAFYNRTRDKALRQMKHSLYGPAGQAINAWVFFGNGPVLCETVPQKREGLNPFRFTSVPWGQYVMAEGDDGRMDQFIRCLKLPAHQIVKRFGASNLSDEIQKAETKDPLREFEILHSIMPRDFQGDYKKSTIKDAKDMMFASCWVEKDKKKLIAEGGYRKFPVAIARYDLISGETYARGPSELALPDAKSLSQADQKALLKWDRELDPPTLTKRNSIVGRVLNKRAGGDTIVSGDPRNTVVPLFENGNWQAHDTMAERKEQAILRIYHVNEILNLLSRESPEMTAFEVNARLTLLQQILGPVFGLLNAEFLEVIVDVMIDNMAHMGMLTDAPDGINPSYDIVYEGPLARAQRNQEITNIQQSVSDMAGIQPFFPEVVKIVDWEKMTRRLWEIRGTQDLLVSSDDFKDEQDKMIAAANATKAAGLAAGGAQALGQAAPGIKVLSEIAQGGQKAA